MEDDFEREFADELSMIQDEGGLFLPSLATGATCKVSRKRPAEDSPIKEQRLKVRHLDGNTSLLASESVDGVEGDESTLSEPVILRNDIEGSTGTMPEDHARTHVHDFPSQHEKGTSFIDMANASSVQVDNSWADEFDYNSTSGAIEDARDVEQQDLVSESRSQSSHVLKRAPLGSYITITSSEGDRVYLRMKSKGQDSNQSGSFHTQSGLQLLKVPFSELKESVEEERRRKLIESSNDVLQSLKSNEELEEGSQLLFSDPGDNNQDIDKHLLWVEKYSPKHYTELLSDDGINRTLLSWLKLWDEVVFDKPIALRGRPGCGTNTKGAHSNDESTSAKKPPGRKFEKRMEYQDPTAFSGFEALDETGRPQIKLALLCGAPGLGKTTLAHIIAKHAGYNVVEVNASDDRSPEVFTRIIESSTQMQAVLTPTTKPNCLIIDEIDGAPTAAVNILIDLIKKKDATAAKKKKSGLGLLSRPIICICNDQYAPSLRHLRQYSLLLYFPPTVSARLASRLHQVMKREKMTAAMSTLMALCEKTSNDIRSCLNTLQFLSRKQKNISLAHIQGASVGQKDAQRSLFSLWKEIFQLSATKKHTLNQGPLRLAAESSVAADRGMGATSIRFYNILSACIATGEYEKVTNGLFENYLSVKFKDPNMEAISVGQDWMVFSDELQQQVAHTQNFMFIGYLPYLSVAFHFLFAAPSKTPIRYPNTNYEVFLQKQKNKHLLTTVLTEVPPYIKRTVTPTLLVIELLPPLTEVLAPTFRPVSTQLYSTRERQQLVDLVGTMISYGLTFRQERGSDGQYTYVLEPNIEELTRFSGLAQKKQLSYSAKQLIAREIEVEKLRRAEAFLTKRNDLIDEQHKSKKVVTQREVNPKQVVPQIKEEKEQQYAVDFFGRRVSQSTCKKSGMKGNASGSFALHSLWFKFNEGFSNAVRRPVHMKDLL